MLLFEILRRDKLQRLTLTIRQEGFASAWQKTWRYLSARLRGLGFTSLHNDNSAQGHSSEYMTRTWLEMAELGAFHISTSPAILQKNRKIAMIGDLNLAQCRKYRVEQPAELWAKKNVNYQYAHYQDTRRSISLLQDATHVMFYRLASSPLASMLAYEARRLRLPILYDLDDPLFSISAYATYQNMKALPKWRKEQFVNATPLYLESMNSADLVTVSTPKLGEHAQQYTSRPVHLRRNFADRATLKAAAIALRQRPSKGGGFRVCFASGSRGHEIDFAEVQEDIVRFLDAADDRILMILGHFDKSLLPEALHSRVELYPFAQYENYLVHLATADVAVMPLANDIFNQCKSAVRVIDAASVEVPSIVSSVSDMSSLIENDINGYVIPSGSSWLGTLEYLARNRTKTRRLGKAARQGLEQHWGAKPEYPIVDRQIIDWVCL